VLIIEDDPTILDIMREGLADEGYRSTGTTNLPDAIAALRAGHYDVVLTDAFRPTTLDATDGQWATLETLRLAAGPTPVVIVTAHRIEDYADYQNHGFAAVLGKPFDLDQLYETVRRVLAGQR
jgi:CheY-like chemotaxis protein